MAYWCSGSRITWFSGCDPGLCDAGVCGSGDYYQYKEDPRRKNQRRHHILDPVSLGSAHKSIGITVVAPTAELADALATTLFIAGLKNGLEMLKKFTDGSLVSSPDFPPFLLRVC